ncbi:hypothetical protein [Rossellomorea aquimaris]|uniref:hypothetical protein n=1 Tax=Rossellomorea aquimaris TaxID=189382 RepID=UPI0007D05650|nr:hypothetical protein [Rossellomorea aquimaris]
MSINGSIKEFILTFTYSLNNKHLLEDIIESKLTNIELEVKRFGRYIDLLAIDYSKGVEVYFENQLTKSDNTHLEGILNIIDNIEEGIIIWQSLKFQEKHLRIIKETLHSNRKNICFYALELNPEVIETVKKLNNLYILDIYSNLNSISDVHPHNKLVFKHIVDMPVKKLEVFHLMNKIDLYSNEGYEKKNRQFISYLRKTIPFFLNFHRSKSNSNIINRIVSIGAGKEDIKYKFSLSDNKYRGFIEIVFEKNAIETFEEITKDIPILKEKIHSNIILKKNAIRYNLPVFENNDECFSYASKIFSKMIFFFSPFTYK